MCIEGLAEPSYRRTLNVVDAHHSGNLGHWGPVRSEGALVADVGTHREGSTLGLVDRPQHLQIMDTFTN